MENDKYKGLDESIADEISRYETIYFKEDLPIPFCGLKIYPATVHDYEIFCNCSDCLTLNRKLEAKGFKMSDLDYLLSKTDDKNSGEGVYWSYKIQKLLEIIFKIKNGFKCTKCGKIIEYTSEQFRNYLLALQKANDSNEEIPQLLCPDCGGQEYIEMIKFVRDPDKKNSYLLIDGQKISKDDFKRLRQIVLFQNFPDYHDESWVDPAIKADHDAKMELERKKNDVHATLEKKIVCLSITTNYSFEDIYKMSIRKFTLALETVDDLINYKIIKSASMSGLVSLPKDFKLEHWIYKPHKDMYGDAYKDVEQVVSQINSL